MTTSDLEKVIRDIVSEAVKLKNKYTDQADANVEFVDIFSKDKIEYLQLEKIIAKVGDLAHSTPTGDICRLKEPLETTAGKLYLVKVRKPDEKLKFRGDADFNTDYDKLKQKYKNSQHFEVIIRKKFEMLRLSDPEFGVMACFSNVPVSRWISE